MTDNDEINELLKLQADRIAELEKWEERWSKRCQRQQDRIAELEKVIQDGIKAFGEIQEKQLKNKLGICISAEEYQKTHEEFSTKAHERRGWEYAEELEQERRKQADRIAELEKQGEPVAWMFQGAFDISTYVSFEKPNSYIYPNPTPLYTAPQTKPLSDEEIESIYYKDFNFEDADMVKFARAIEERHGIK